jgi:hypothetical protein
MCRVEKAVEESAVILSMKEAPHSKHSGLATGDSSLATAKCAAPHSGLGHLKMTLVPSTIQSSRLCLRSHAQGRFGSVGIDQVALETLGGR